MNKINYDEKMKETLASLGGTPRLLLHSCCGPCSTYCIEELSPHFFVTVFYYNPNIDTDEEYEKRKNEQRRFIEAHPWKNPVAFCGEEHREEAFYAVAKGKENCPEGGERCFACYRLRLEETAKYAREHDFDYFATTLTVSPLKNADKLNAIGAELEKEYGVKYLFSDFKKRDGYKKSTEISKEYGMYRQNYCGCAFSKNAKREEERKS